MSDRHSLQYGTQYSLTELMQRRGKMLVPLAEAARVKTSDLRALVSGTNTQPVPRYMAQKIADALDVDIDMVNWPRGIANKPAARAISDRTTRPRVPGSAESKPCDHCFTILPLVRGDKCPNCGASLTE